MHVSDYLTESGTVKIDFQVRAEIAYNHRSSTVVLDQQKPTNAIETHFAERLVRSHGISTMAMALRGLDADSLLFVSGRTGEGLKISAQYRDGEPYHSANQLSRLKPSC